MSDANRIQIVKTNTGYNAKYIGPHAAEIKALFGTDSIPTPFTPNAIALDVVKEVAKRNPGVEVSL